MFGDVAFAQAPFAALGGGGVVYDVALSETGSGESTTTLAASQLVATNAETGSSVAAVNTINNIFNNRIVEAASVASAQAVLANLLARVSEIASTQATQTNTAVLLATQAEYAVALASPTANSTVLASILEAISGVDENTAVKSSVVFIDEAGSSSDATSTGVVFLGYIAEVAATFAALSALRTANVYPVGIQLRIEIGGVLVWAVIDDSQTPNWQNVSTTQTPGWTILPS